MNSVLFSMQKTPSYKITSTYKKDLLQPESIKDHSKIKQIKLLWPSIQSLTYSMAAYFICHCLCLHPVHWCLWEFSFRNTTAADTAEKNELLLTRDKEVLRGNGWFKLHRQAGLLKWRKTFPSDAMSPPNMLHLSDGASQIHTQTHTQTVKTSHGDGQLARCYVNTCQDVL